MIDTAAIKAFATCALMSCRQAVMASHSASVPGYPFTSVIPIGVRLNGQVITLLGESSQHSRNIMLDTRISMLMHDDLEVNWQAATRLSVIGRMSPLQCDEAELAQIRHSFYLLHPEFLGFDGDDDYQFWQLEPVRFRFITESNNAQWLDQIDCELFNLTESERNQLNATLFSQQGYLCQVVQASRYGLQILANGRVCFLVLIHPVANIHALIEQIDTGKYNDPTWVD